MKVILVNNSIELARYLNSRSGVEVIEQYPNLVSKRDELFSKITRADRLLYLLTAENETFTKDLNTIAELLKNYGNMFKFDEIIFLIEQNSSAVKYSHYIKVVMRDFPNQKWTVPISDGKISFNETYDVLLGRTDVNLNKEARETVYIKPRGSQTKAVYEKDPTKRILEPFSYANVKQYDEVQNKIAQIDSGKTYQDVDNKESNISIQFDSPDFGSSEITENLSEQNIIICTGKPSVGTTMYNTALAISASKLKKDVMIINMSDDAMYAEYIIDMASPYGISFNEYHAKNLLTLNSFEFKNNLCALTFHNLDNIIRLDALRYYLKNTYKAKAELIFIEVPIHLAQIVARLVKHKLKRLIYITESVELEVDKLKPSVKEFSDNFNTSVWINNFSRVRYENQILSSEKVWENLPKGMECFDSVKIENLDLDESLYSSILGGDK